MAIGLPAIELCHEMIHSAVKSKSFMDLRARIPCNSPQNIS
ncbi:MAG: hypothetical protein ABFD98_16865 [Syntrophobacteraceae bacterium]